MPLPQKTERNRAIVALYICGFPQRAIERILKVDRRNVQMFIRKYTPRYKEEIMSNISNYIVNKKKPV